MPNEEYFVQNAVVSHLKRKDANGFTETPIGPELKYVGAQTNSSIHNLEEQLIIGAPKQTVGGPGMIQPSTGRRSEFEITEFKPDPSVTQNYYYFVKHIDRDPYLSFDTNSNKLTVDLKPKVYMNTEEIYYVFDKEAEDPEQQAKEVVAKVSLYDRPEGSTDPDDYKITEEIMYAPLPGPEP